jgi:hypothetical protein
MNYCELFQKYGNTHKIVKGGDINEDLNKAANNKRSKYLWEVSELIL